MHAHTAPALFKRHIDDAALAEYAAAYGMRGFVLKDHDASTTGRAYYVNRMYPHVESYGSVVLNRSVGGLNPYVAEAAIQYGARVVWMPSNHSKYHAEFFDMPDYPQFGRPRKQLPGEGVTVFEEDGRTLTREARTICEIVAENDVALATGHLSLAEIRALQDAAVDAGVSRFIVTHANWSLCKLDLDVQRELIAKGATMEYVACSCVSPIFWEQQPGELAEWIIALRGENVVLGSDLGQFAGPPHPEGLRMLPVGVTAVGIAADRAASAIDLQASSTSPCLISASARNASVSALLCRLCGSTRPSAWRAASQASTGMSSLSAHSLSVPQ